MVVINMMLRSKSRGRWIGYIARGVERNLSVYRMECIVGMAGPDLVEHCVGEASPM